jgi:hypothetical protein
MFSVRRQVNCYCSSLILRSKLASHLAVIGIVLPAFPDPRSFWYGLETLLWSPFFFCPAHIIDLYFLSQLSISAAISHPMGLKGINAFSPASVCVCVCVCVCVFTVIGKRGLIALFTYTPLAPRLCFHMGIFKPFFYSQAGLSLNVHALKEMFLE